MSNMNEYQIFKTAIKWVTVTLVALFMVSQLCIRIVHSETMDNEYTMGQTPEDVETLSYKYCNDYKGLVIWMKKNFEYSSFMQQVIKSPRMLLKDGYGDCEDFAIFYYAILRRGNQYQPTTIMISGGKFIRGHFICVIRDYGDMIVLSNLEYIKTNCHTLSELADKYYPGSTLRIVDFSSLL